MQDEKSQLVSALLLLLIAHHLNSLAQYFVKPAGTVAHILILRLTLCYYILPYKIFAYGGSLYYKSNTYTITYTWNVETIHNHYILMEATP
jgi:hypothetical protein